MSGHDLSTLYPPGSFKFDLTIADPENALEAKALFAHAPRDLDFLRASATFGDEHPVRLTYD